MPLDGEEDVPVCTERVEEVNKPASSGSENRIAKKVGIYYYLRMGIVLADMTCI